MADSNFDMIRLLQTKIDISLPNAAGVLSIEVL
jgi:hypothetical protein